MRRSSRRKRAPKRPRVPRVGAKVVVRFGGHDVPATVIEDRGNIGVGGRRLIRIRLNVGAGSEIELPLSELGA